MADNTVKTITSYHAVKSVGENFATHQLMLIVANRKRTIFPPYRFFCTISSVS